MVFPSAHGVERQPQEVEANVMHKRRNISLTAGLVSAAILGWACDRPDATPAAPEVGALEAHFGQPFCVPFKMTGGGRIDFPPGTAQKNPPASHIFQTFGAHVMDRNGDCQADQGVLQWIDHRPEFRINGRPLNFHSIAVTFAEAFFPPETDCSDGAARWGGRVVLRNTGDEGDFEVFDCDNGEPGRGRDGFGLRVVLDNGATYEVLCPDPSLPPAEPACTLTGGNRQFHPTHF